MIAIFHGLGMGGGTAINNIPQYQLKQVHVVPARVRVHIVPRQR